MSVLILASGNIGPFKSIETLADRLRCDGVDYPFTVIGAYTISADDSLAPVPPVVPEPIPAKVTRRQGLQALYLNGVTLDMLEAKLIEVLTGNARELALIELRESLEFEYDRQLTTMMAAAFGLDKAALFRQAGKL